MKFTVLRAEGPEVIEDVWQEDAQASFVTETNGALTIRAIHPKAGSIIVCVYGPGQWLLVRRVEPTP